MTTDVGFGPQVSAVTCAQSGKCAAGGSGFAVGENQGTWGQAQFLVVGG